MRQFSATNRAVQQARDLGIQGDVRARLSRMAAKAANFTSRNPPANRRFERYVLLIDGDTIQNVSTIEVANEQRRA